VKLIVTVALRSLIVVLNTHRPLVTDSLTPSQTRNVIVHYLVMVVCQSLRVGKVKQATETLINLQGLMAVKSQRDIKGICADGIECFWDDNLNVFATVYLLSGLCQKCMLSYCAYSPSLSFSFLVLSATKPNSAIQSVTKGMHLLKKIKTKGTASKRRIACFRVHMLEVRTRA